MDDFRYFHGQEPSDIPSEQNPEKQQSDESFAFHSTDESSFSDANTEQQPQPEPEIPHTEQSYTPSQYGFVPDYSQQQNAFQQSPVYPQPAYPQYSVQGGPPKKSKKQRTPVTLGTVIAIALACAILGSAGTGAAFMYVSNMNSNASSSAAQTVSSGDSTVKNINVVTTDTDSPAAAVAEKVLPSVVGVQTVTKTNNYFYGSSESTGSGSGVIYSSDGYIITNYHVISAAVENSGTLSVYLESDAETAVPATVVGYDVTSDIAVIKVNKTGLTPVDIGDSSKASIGQTAYVIGSPGGLEFMSSVSAGIISGLNRTIQLENTEEMNLIQTDAAVNPGNSGGALVNSQGQLIGITSAKISSTDYEGMGFAIPVNSAVEIVTRIINNVNTPKSYLGLEISTYYDSSTLQQMGYPAGVVISGVTSGSPGDEAGLQRGDIITKFNGTAISSYAAYNSEKDKTTPGETISITVFRQGKTYEVQVTLGTANG